MKHDSKLKGENMKTKILRFSTMVLLYWGVIFSGCSDKDIQDQDKYTLWDSLQGKWWWTFTYDPKKGMIENDFESVVHFLSMNSDSTINYETYKNDTLKKIGKLKIYKTARGREIEPNILLHYNVTNENYFEFISEDTLKLFELFEDRNEHFYKKMN